MDGIDLTKELSRLSFDVPVMVMTGHSDGGSREIALRAGAREFLTKPFPASDLIAGLHRMLLRCNPFKEHEFQK